MKKRLFGLFLMFCALPFMEIKAQEFMPFISSPYAGVTAGQLNPASIAGSKYKFDVTLFGGSGGVHNDLISFSRKDIILNMDFYKDMWSKRSDLNKLNLPSDLRGELKDYVKKNQFDWGNDPYGGVFTGQMDILNLMYSFSDRFSMAAGFSKRWIGSLHGANLPISASARLGDNFPESGDTWAFREVTSTNTTTAAVAIYNQIFITGAYTLLEKETSRLKAGITAKVLFGGKSAYAYMDGYRISPRVEGYALTGTGISQISGGKAGIATDGKLGFGFDLGLEYEYRPSELSGNEVSEYRFKAGASILDMGGFGSKDARNRSLVGGYRGFPKSVDGMLNAYGQGNLGDYTMGLPTVVTLSGDYRFGSSPVFLNFTPIFALGQNSESKAYKFTSFNLAPHVEWKNFGASLPVQLDQFSNFNIGLGLRAWRHVWIGSNTILTNLFSKGSKAGDLHVMVKVPIMKKTVSDRDGDGIPDHLDRCPDTPGLARFQGCPDTDGDGIPDIDDACPNEAGPECTQGCPDRDGDCVADKDDRCPDVPGPKELKGCPDTDGDGIPDIDDACPDEPGPACTNGCPDGDGDCIADKDDKCPDEPGPACTQGCPDRDGDCVADFEDECPDVPGLKEYKGCPAPTTPVIENVEFDIDKYNIKPQYYASLDKVVDLMAKNPEYNVKIVGHTDITYTRAYNMALSKRRAEAVKSYLIRKKAEAKRISTEYYGPDKPIADNNTVDGRSRNRRAEITIIIK